MLTTEEKLRLENNYLKMELVKKDLAALKDEQASMLNSACERLGKKTEDLLTFNPFTGELTFKEAPKETVGPQAGPLRQLNTKEI